MFTPSVFTWLAHWVFQAARYPLLCRISLSPCMYSITHFGLFPLLKSHVGVNIPIPIAAPLWVPFLPPSLNSPSFRAVPHLRPITHLCSISMLCPSLDPSLFLLYIHHPSWLLHFHHPFGFHPHLYSISNIHLGSIPICDPSPSQGATFRFLFAQCWVRIPQVSLTLHQTAVPVAGFESHSYHLKFVELHFI